MSAHIIALTFGLLLDRIIGDPPNWTHPVRWIGSFITKLTTLLNKGRHRKVKGIILLISVVAVTFTSVFTVVFTAYKIHFIFGIVVESILCAIGFAQKSLKDAAMSVYQPLVNGDLREARMKLSWIVGRDTEKLSESEITRAVVETVSENTSDGITAPLFFAFLFGAPGLWLYKAVNTLDSMVGHENEKFQDFGYASAKMDDVLNYIPSRVTGYIILLWTKNYSKQSLRTRFANWWKDAKKHPSPNSGYLEAATACQLGVQLGGLNMYKGIPSNRPRMGISENPLRAIHILYTIRQMHIAIFLFWLMMIVIGGVLRDIT
ncbi:adenosylcobinamide-phosphate synthase CbiB [Paenisporosarcina sp. OV554]|uniref:adenosylcobinamide-phosphate synthase CbiB n=1 Tax=Paenisporosarcina sp. OV554 TaxID=2135694 RepID=UPI000D393B09|nr:adenosylcobinamide-phosphate synthase CbiB [Paenisporosarcina sp. OV554]PUB12997.1 adenosylcobinamide-phosphate synthase [Paenisporosarcina sp. OV554]